MKFSNKNIVLDNGQMILLKCKDDLIADISDYFNKILIEFIQSEEYLKECYDIRDRYINNKDNINNTSRYIKKLYMCGILLKF